MAFVIVNAQGKPYTSEQLGVTVYPAREPLPVCSFCEAMSNGEEPTCQSSRNCGRGPQPEIEDDEQLRYETETGKAA